MKKQANENSQEGLLLGLTACRVLLFDTAMFKQGQDARGG